MGPPPDSSHRKSLLPTANTFTAVRRNTLHFTPTSPGRPRWLLHLQASTWRFLMSIGMLLHRLAPPRPPKPDFSREIPSTLSKQPGEILLQCYVPVDWETQRRLWVERPLVRGQMQRGEEVVVEGKGDEEGEGRDVDGAGRGRASLGRRVSSSMNLMGQSFRRRSVNVRRWGHYPVVINFHGGGFTLGTATDDARWCGTVVEELNAVVISVDYRLAPEHPFPTAVEDGADAVLWVHEHADELGIDREKIALSGFSSGANMAFTVPLRLYDEQHGVHRVEPSQEDRAAAAAANGPPSTLDSPASSSSSTRVASPSEETDSAMEMTTPSTSPAHPISAMRPHKPAPRATTRAIPNISIRCLVPFYPSLDYTLTRDQRRTTLPPHIRKDHELPALFTNLFDDSYLHPPQHIALDSPYLSPGVAPTELLRDALPQTIILHTCEYDMLLEEGEVFRRRLEGPEIGKQVKYTMVPGVPHGWDKAPNPLRPTKGVRGHYLRACREMRGALGGMPGRDRERATRVEGLGGGVVGGDGVGKGDGGEANGEGRVVTAARKGSVQVVR
ncbi:hypothetical protein LTR53_000040 [Teratosphaeriaceae sp. CCFEE 6253]|nr:hypothetical protein LTR53_000040 [Teratosphaeriaceae sp. CCFEE 6253]